MSQVVVFLKMLKSQMKKSLARNADDRKLKIVLGNAACDLDSAACTLAIALFKSLKSECENDFTFPVFNMAKEEMLLKTEVLHFFNKMSLSLDDLIYRADIDADLDLTKELGQLEVTLVDHHFDKNLNRSVMEIFDHHLVQEQINPNVISTILPVGSCSTLVMQHIAADPVIIRIMFRDYKEIVDMCYGAILLDTVNFNQSCDRFTETDITLTRFIELNLGLDPNKKEPRKKYYDELLAIRNNVSSLTPIQLLYKDYKMVSSLPICGLPMLVQEYLCSYPDAEQVLKEFSMKKRSTEVVLVGMKSEHGTVKRDLGFYTAPNSPLLQATDKPKRWLDEELAKLKDPDFQLNLLKFPINGFEGVRIYQQRNLQLTRKHLIPAINNIMREIILPPF